MIPISATRPRGGMLAILVSGTIPPGATCSAMDDDGGRRGPPSSPADTPVGHFAPFCRTRPTNRTAMYKVIADGLVLLHMAFVVFVLLGGLAVAWRPRLAWLH